MLGFGSGLGLRLGLRLGLGFRVRVRVGVKVRVKVRVRVRVRVRVGIKDSYSGAPKLGFRTRHWGMGLFLGTGGGYFPYARHHILQR